MATTTTFKFIDIFPDYESFTEFCKDEDLIINGDDVETQTFINYIYKTLLYKFGTVDVAYSTIVEFKMEFYIVLSDTFEKYYTQLNLIRNIYKLGDEEFTKLTSNVISSAQQNNKKLDDPNKWLGFINNQQYTASDLSKFSGYVQAIKEIPSFKKEWYTENFKYLFWSIFTPDYYITEKENYENGN